MKITSILQGAGGSLFRAVRWGSLCVLLSLATSLRAEDSLASLTKSFFEKAVASAKEIVTGEKASESEEAGSEHADPDEAAREAVLAEARDAIFHEEGGFHFTQSRWGAKPTPYQVEGLEVAPLGEATLTAGDHAAGIDKRLPYAFQAVRHRRFHEQTGWGRWMEGAPPHLDNLILVREQGIWRVASSPLWAYSLN
ncbi:MAG: hypothetical protein KDN18_14555 [Verrucomicrobiae bacterium]|nr:hypothetical protein [Verrucomicrobiae bacterium]